MAALLVAAAGAAVVIYGPALAFLMDIAGYRGAVRALLPESGGASLIGERLTVRLLAPSGLALRRSLAPIIALLSPAGSIPRLWTL